MRRKEKYRECSLVQKRLLLLLIFLVFCLNCFHCSEIYAEEQPIFSDVSTSDWFAEAAAWAKEVGMLSGYPDGTFRPNKAVSYGEFLRIVIDEDSAIRQGHWAETYYNEGLRRGIFTETEILKGELDQPISRKYMALVFAGLLQEAGITQNEYANEESVTQDQFSDTDFCIAFHPCINRCVSHKILNGYPDATFRPQHSLTRAEAVVAALRLKDCLKENRGSERRGSKGTENVSVEDAMDPVYKAYLDSILQSLRVTGSNGNYSYRFDVPEAPGESDVFFDINFISKTGAQILNGQTYTSRDITSRAVNNQIKGLSAISDLGTVGFNFAIKPNSSGYWHDYMLIWKTDNVLSLRIEYWKQGFNNGLSEYSTRALDYAFSWQ